MIFFSAHGVPLAYVEEAGDPYKAEMEECVDLIMEELERRRLTNAYTLAYQVCAFSIISDQSGGGLYKMESLTVEEKCELIMILCFVLVG